MMAPRQADTRSLIRARKRTSAPGPKPGFSRTEIAQAAILIADNEGLEAVTMQRVARKVGVTTMALYRYFPSKAELLAVMIDSAADRPPEFDNYSISWKDRLREWAGRCAAIYRDHPWFLEATTARRSLMGLNELSWMEVALAMLAEAGLSPKESYYAFLAIIGHVRGHATFVQIKKLTGSRRKWIRELTYLLRSEPGKYRALEAVSESGALSADGNETFYYGLDCILDGLSASNRRSMPPTRGRNSR